MPDMSFLGLPLRAARRLLRVVTGAGSQPPPPPRPAHPMDLREPAVEEAPPPPPPPPAPEALPAKKAPTPRKAPARPPREPGRQVIVDAHRTPNPNARKFSCNVPLLDGDEPLHVSNASEAAEIPLARALFALEGVRSIFVVPEFVSVNKAPEANWETLVPAVKAAIVQARSG